MSFLIIGSCSFSKNKTAPTVMEEPFHIRVQSLLERIN